jgi:hypothetical protein
MGDWDTKGTGPSASMWDDLKNDIMVNAKIAPISKIERGLAEEHLKPLMGPESFERGRELIMFDRRYPSYEIIK